jgi:RHH-type proline utilization regulon transcriptional repressor/proline dehydrogenase/delta 1-pyrroline-5-carboxylate dehydrogenase
MDTDSVETRTRKIGRRLLDALRNAQPHIFEGRWWDEQLMELAMDDEAVKAQLFRFVDVLPMLVDQDRRQKRPDAVATHLHEYLEEVRDRLPWALKTGLAAAPPGTLRGRMLGRAARVGVARQARRFIAGSTLREVLRVAREQRSKSLAFSLDILGEAVTSDAEAQRYFERYLELLRGVTPAVNAWREVPQIDRDHQGPIPRCNISIKLSALDSQFDAIDPEGTAERVARRLRELLRVARAERAFIHVDMESYATKDLTLAIFRRVLMEEEFRDTSDVGIVIQCYLKDAERDLAELAQWARARGTPVWVRIVKGAYWDYETIHARAANWPIPVFQKKWESDACFERAARFVLENRDALRPALASHNVRSLALGLAAAEKLGLDQREVEVQMLYGMADAEKQALVDMGYRVRVYMPYGELIPGMAYLVRRLLENTSNDSFLRSAGNEEIDEDVLLAAPGPPGGRNNG